MGVKNNIKSLFLFYNWITKYRSAGVPLEYRYNKDYIDWFINYRPFLLKYKDIHAGEDCFIVGNGPSLNKMDLKLLNDYHVFGMNKINMIFKKQKLKLSYHVAVNKFVVEQIENELNDGVFGCPSFISYTASNKVSYNNSDIYKILTNGRWSFYNSVLQPISEGYTVTFVAMQLAFYMGFKNIFLIGVDHNFQQKGKPNEEQKLEGDDNNHFHPDYFKGQQWHLADLEGNEASYALAKHQFHAHGREILDATVNGKLNIYRKLSFEDALEMAKKT